MDRIDTESRVASDGSTESATSAPVRPRREADRGTTPAEEQILRAIRDIVGSDDEIEDDQEVTAPVEAPRATGPESPSRAFDPDKILFEHDASEVTIGQNGDLLEPPARKEVVEPMDEAGPATAAEPEFDPFAAVPPSVTVDTGVEVPEYDPFADSEMPSATSATALRPGVSIRVTVGANPLIGATVKVIVKPEPITATTTTHGAMFDLEPGAYDIEIVHDGYVVQQNIEVASATDVIELDLQRIYDFQ